MRRRSFLALSGASLVCGCAGAVHQLPQVDGDDVHRAQAEVQSAKKRQRRTVTQAEALDTLETVTRLIRLPAAEACGEIVVDRGLIEYAANEEEVCTAIAHEIGHQAANHVMNHYRNSMAGALIGSVLLVAAAAARVLSADS